MLYNDDILHFLFTETPKIVSLHLLYTVESFEFMEPILCITKFLHIKTFNIVNYWVSHWD